MKSKTQAFLATAASLLFAIAGGSLLPTTSGAATAPSALWMNSNNQVVSGKVTLIATSAPSDGAQIDSWCLTENGAPITTNVAATTNNVPGVTTEKEATTFNSSTGCWSIPSTEASSSNNLSGQGSIPFDTTAWTNGNYTFQLTVTDTSGLSTTSSVLTLAVSNAGPSVIWNTTSNESVSGITYILASAAPSPKGTAQIDSWCLTENGAPITTNVAATTNNVPGVTTEKEATTFNSSTGCWSIPSTEASSSNNLSGQGSIPFDTTAWTNGNYTFQLKVTDTSGLSTTSSVLTLAVSNAGPSVIWNTTNNESVSGITYILASAAPSPKGTAQIDSWCLTENGAPITTNVAATTNNVPGVTTEKEATTFNSSTGCWSIPSTEASSSNNLSGQGSIPFDTTAWTNGNYTFQLTVTDTSGLSTTSSVLTLAVSNALPIVEVTGIESGQSYSGTITVGLSATFSLSQSTLTVINDCLTLDSGPCFAAPQVSIATWRLKNGPHTLTGSIVDSDGRTTDATPITFTTNNPNARVTSYSRVASRLNWNSTSATERIAIHYEYGSHVVINYGTSRRMATTFSRNYALSKSSFLTVRLLGLKTSTKYFAQITTSGLNGSSKTKIFSFTTPTIPAKPSPPPPGPPTTGTGGSTGGSGATGGCHPISNEGTCYEPGEYCRDSDHGVTGVAGDGENIVCSDNDGWRWEPY